MRLDAYRGWLWLLLLLPLSACDRYPPPPRAPAPSTTTTVQVPAPDNGDSYRINVTDLPLAPGDAVMSAALRAYTERQRREFFASLARRNDDGDAQRATWTLSLQFEVRANSSEWLSVVARGDAYTGGAHGNPLLASFTLHRRSARLLGIGDLFSSGESGLRAISQFARRTLTERAQKSDADEDPAARSRIYDGTEARAENFAAFAIKANGSGRASGIVVIFPPYQIAAYAAGALEVDIPLRVFAAVLKPELRDSFSAVPRK